MLKQKIQKQNSITNNYHTGKYEASKRGDQLIDKIFI